MTNHDDYFERKIAEKTAQLDILQKEIEYLQVQRFIAKTLSTSFLR